MANQTFLIPTEFKNIRTGEIDYGFRLFDNYDEANVFPWDLGSIPDDDLECLRLCLQAECEKTQGILEWVEENEASITIGDTEYSWGEVKGCFEKSDED